MEDIERATPAQIDTVRKKFNQFSPNTALCGDDIERVKSDDLWIRRFIAAHDGDVDKAAKMLFETCQWRKEFGVNDLDHKGLSQAMIEKGTLFIRNKDNWGKDLLIFKAKTHNKGINEMEDIKKFIVYWFERAERLTKSDQITLVFDMKDTGWSNMDMDFIRYLITLTKEYYPYLINYLLILDMPWLLKSAWNIIKTWLDKKAVDRIKFVDKKTMKDYIDLNNQLVDWGGSDSYEYSFQPEVKVKVNSNRKPSLKSLSINNNLSASEDSSPEGKGKKSNKVQFTDRDGTTDRRSIDVVENFTPVRPAPVRATPVVPVQSPRPLSPSSGGDTSPAPREEPSSRMGPPLFLFDTNDVINFEQSGADLIGDIEITNVADENILFKIKSTVPDAYSVRPAMGVLAPGADATIRIIAYNGNRVNVTRDRFQVQASVVPTGLELTADDSDSGTEDYPRLRRIWRTIVEPNQQLQSKRLRCAVIGSRREVQELGNEVQASRGSVVTMNQDEMRRGLADLEKNMSNEFKKMLQANNQNIMKTLYIILGAILFFGILIYFTIPSGSTPPVILEGSGSSPCSFEGQAQGQLATGQGPDPPPGPSAPSTSFFTLVGNSGDNPPTIKPMKSETCVCS